MIFISQITCKTTVMLIAIKPNHQKQKAIDT